MPDPAWHAVIDCAQDPRLEGLVRSCKGALCLFKGKDLDPRIVSSAPWLVPIDPTEPLLATWQQHGQGLHWGLMVLSPLTTEQLQRHFRRFLQAQLPDGMTVLFRFYDPRVFNTYIRAATPEEREPWFRDVLQYSVEAPGGAQLHHYRLEGDRLYDGATALG